MGSGVVGPVRFAVAAVAPVLPASMPGRSAHSDCVRRAANHAPWGGPRWLTVGPPYRTIPLRKVAARHDRTAGFSACFSNQGNGRRNIGVHQRVFMSSLACGISVFAGARPPCVRSVSSWALEHRQARAETSDPGSSLAGVRMQPGRPDFVRARRIRVAAARDGRSTFAQPCALLATSDSVACGVA